MTASRLSPFMWRASLWHLECAWRKWSLKRAVPLLLAPCRARRLFRHFREPCLHIPHSYPRAETVVMKMLVKMCGSFVHITHWNVPYCILCGHEHWFAGNRDRSLWGMNCLRPLEHCGRGFESHSRHGCLHAFILFVFCWVGSGLATGRSPVQGALPFVYRTMKTEKAVRAQKRAVEPLMNEHWFSSFGSRPFALLSTVPIAIEMAVYLYDGHGYQLLHSVI
jgi:hypothetical protein